MPAWLTWKLFWKVAPYIGAALALGAAVWYLDHRGYQRAEQESIARENERKLQAATFAILIGRQADGIEEAMQTKIGESDAKIVGALSGLDITNRTVIQPTLVKEIRSEERFSDPAAGITDGMRSELNRARGLSRIHSCTTAADGSIECALSPAQPAAGQLNSNAGN